MNKWINEWVNEWMNEWINGQINEWMNKWTYELFKYLDSCRYDEGLHGIIWPPTENGQTVYAQCSIINGTNLKGNFCHFTIYKKL